jgi:hypothetical protein
MFYLILVTDQPVNHLADQIGTGALIGGVILAAAGAVLEPWIKPWMKKQKWIPDWFKPHLTPLT